MTFSIKTQLQKSMKFLFSEEPADFKKIPIIINNFNRLETLKILIRDLEDRGYFNIFIIDNQSTYPPLLEYYHQCDYRVFRLKKNMGFKALWKSGLWYRFFRGYFCYTDSDLSLVPECPENFMERLYELLDKYPEVHKTGLSLKIDNLPDHYDRKQEVLEWESKFFRLEKERNVFIAPIDTTFALYRPFSRRGKRDGSDEMLRVGHPIQCEHLPWYINSQNPTNEEMYYNESIRKPTHWSSN